MPGLFNLKRICSFYHIIFYRPLCGNFLQYTRSKTNNKSNWFSILFQAFTNIGIIYFKKELEFNKEFIYQLSGTLADFIVAVSAVLILKMFGL